MIKITKEKAESLKGHFKLTDKELDAFLLSKGLEVESNNKLSKKSKK